MSKMYLFIPVTNDRYSPGFTRIKESVLQWQFAKFVANEFKNRFQKVIDRQSIHWKPLSHEYLLYKERHGLSLKVWEATGLIKRSICVRQRNGYLEIGPDKRKKHKGVSITDIAFYMEYGTSRMPARPIFRPVLRSLRRDYSMLLNKFLKGVK